MRWPASPSGTVARDPGQPGSKIDDHPRQDSAYRSSCLQDPASALWIERSSFCCMPVSALTGLDGAAYNHNANTSSY